MGRPSASAPGTHRRGSGGARERQTLPELHWGRPTASGFGTAHDSSSRFCAVTRGNIAELAATAFIALLVVFCCRFEQTDTKENRAVAEDPSSEPTGKNYGLCGD
jgi:hypothetical protein